MMTKRTVVLEGPRAETDAILAFFAQWAATRDAGDVEGVAKLYHQDMLIMTRNRSILKGKEGARIFYGENYGTESNRQLLGDVSEIRVFGEVAIVVGRFLTIDEDKGIEDPGYFLIVLRKNPEGEWRIYRDIDTPSPDGLALKPLP